MQTTRCASKNGEDGGSNNEKTNVETSVAKVRVRTVIAVRSKSLSSFFANKAAPLSESVLFLPGFVVLRADFFARVCTH